ncbi:ABC transporter substrate-binding protein [Streptomyces sp. NPDC058579]|uniref:ABC transporter substrate-binding protein n=1 Tax=Streptomyces sp. NPDC058579 TaxID=3346548 RepID=UPI0036600E18
MSEMRAWGFTDDRGTAVEAVRAPVRVAAYVRAGAALLDLGVTPVAVYGSGHDGNVLDSVKAGRLESAGVPYLGAGRALDEARLGGPRPDLIVDVTYDGKSAYALDEGVAERVGVPVVALSVGNEGTLSAIIGRFGELAVALGGGGGGGVVGLGVDGLVGPVGSVDPVVSAEAVLRDAAAGVDVRVLALSGAGPDQVHLARPQAWPELARLAELGVRLVDPGPGPGANWLTADWGRVAALEPGLVLYDSRANAVRPGPVGGAVGGARVAPWNPETPPSGVAYAAFFLELAEALRA